MFAAAVGSLGCLRCLMYESIVSSTSLCLNCLCFLRIVSCMESLDSLIFCWVQKVLVRERSEPVQMCEVDFSFVFSLFPECCFQFD